MRVPHVVIDDHGPFVVVPRGTDHHLRRVLRLQDGAVVTVTDGRGEVADAELVPGGLQVGTWRPASGGAPRVVLWASIGKGAKFDLVVEKATELGVASIRPLVCARGERSTAKRSRWEAIARSALEQSRGGWLPEIGAPLAFADAVRSARGVLLHPGAGGGASTFMRTRPRDVAVGPEGGFTDDEIALAVASGWTVCGLGPRVLRTETAAVVAAALAVSASGGLETQDLPGGGSNNTDGVGLVS